MFVFVITCDFNSSVCSIITVVYVEYIFYPKFTIENKNFKSKYDQLTFELKIRLLGSIQTGKTKTIL